MKQFNIIILSLLSTLVAAPVFAQDDDTMGEEVKAVKKEKKVGLIQ